MRDQKNRTPCCNRERLERVLGRVLRIEAERGATFEELLAYSPRLERRLLEMFLARLESARAASLTAQETPAASTETVRLHRRRKPVPAMAVEQVSPAPERQVALQAA